MCEVKPSAPGRLFCRDVGCPEKPDCSILMNKRPKDNVESIFADSSGPQLDRGAIMEKA